MSGWAGDLSLCLACVMRMFMPDCFGFGDTTDVTTGANTHILTSLRQEGTRENKHTLALIGLLVMSFPGSAAMFYFSPIIPLGILMTDHLSL